MPLLRFQLSSAGGQCSAAKLHRCIASRPRARTALGRRAHDRNGVFRRRDAEPLPARGIRAAARGVAAARPPRLRCGSDPGGEPRHGGTRPLRRLSGRRHQPGLARSAELFARGARAARPHSCGRGHAPRGRGAARRGARELQSGPDVRVARADARGRARGSSASPALSSPRISPTTSSPSNPVRYFTPVRRRCPTRMRRSRFSATVNNCWPTRDSRNTKCRPMRVPGRAAATI